MEMKPTPFSQMAGIDSSHFSKLIKGTRRWNSDIINKVILGLESCGVKITAAQLMDGFDEESLPGLDSKADFRRKMLMHTAALVEEFSKKEREIAQLRRTLDMVKTYVNKHTMPGNDERRKSFLVLKELLEF